MTLSEAPNDPLLRALRIEAAHALEQAVRTSQGLMGIIPAGTKDAQDAAWRAAVHAQAVYTLALQSVTHDAAVDEATPEGDQ